MIKYSLSVSNFAPWQPIAVAIALPIPLLPPVNRAEPVFAISKVASADIGESTTAMQPNFPVLFLAGLY